MGNWFCFFLDVAPIAAIANDVCPFPDYSPSPLLKMLTVNSSLQLSEHYAAVQASLTPPQQQDFTQTLRSTFGREGKVSYGGVGVVALSLAVLFDTVARQVKGEYESYQEPIPGLFLRDPRGTYPPPVHTISKYLRLVPHIANNPTRMRDETEKYLLELKQTATVEIDDIYTAQRAEDITGVNLMKCVMIGKHMALHLQRIANKTIDLVAIGSNKNNHTKGDGVLNLNCDPKVASERFLARLDSSDDAKEVRKYCDLTGGNKSAIENFVSLHLIITMSRTVNPEGLTITSREKPEGDVLLAQTGDFDLKAKALGKWI